MALPGSGGGPAARHRSGHQQPRRQPHRHRSQARGKLLSVSFSLFEVIFFSERQRNGDVYWLGLIENDNSVEEEVVLIYV